jgi:mono/diheme cytochrome c family protein
MKTILIIVALALTTQSSASAAEPSVERGRTLYMSVGCVHCHGTMGQGSNAGLKLAPDPLPAEAIAQFIRATNTQMPAYSADVLSDDAVADIAAFLATIPVSKSADQIPALKALMRKP